VKVGYARGSREEEWGVLDRRGKVSLDSILVKEEGGRRSRERGGNGLAGQRDWENEW
jgi:hypothetical protein